MSIEEPYEALDLEDGESKSFRIEKWEIGRRKIFPEHAPQGKEINNLRVWLPIADKPLFPHYYDLTAVTLVAQMQPLLLNFVPLKTLYTIKKFGKGPQARFSVNFMPV